MIQIDTEPCAAYMDWQQTNGVFFDGVEWGDILHKGLGATPWYLWDSIAGRGHLLLLFRRGPVSIGYLGFPICASPDAISKPYQLESLVGALRGYRRRPQLLRLPLSAFCGDTLQSRGRRHPLLETCIQDLANWRADATNARRRDRAFALRRSGNLAVTKASGAALHALYQSAVARNRGRLRYTRAYFDQLAAADGQGVRIHSRSENGRIVGMVITAHHGDTTYYLHAGTDPAALGSGLADLLICEAITAAKSDGARRFNFLSSPAAQTGLVRFKQKWGGETRDAASHDIALRWTGALLLRWL